MKANQEFKNGPSRWDKDMRDKVLSRIIDRYSDHTEVTAKQVHGVMAEFGFGYDQRRLREARETQSTYSVEKLIAMADTSAPVKVVNGSVPSTPVAAPVAVPVAAPVAAPELYTQKIMDSSVGNLVPDKDSVYVKTAHHGDITKVIKSKKFFPIFITGPSGNGKSMTVVQTCAGLNRELIRINVTAGTDEDDLIGSFRLIDGDTVWQDGPIVEAMVRGAVVLIDEIDMLNPNRAASLFTALEGKGVFIKKIGRLVEPKKGFNIIATANTKGKGSDDGRYMGTNVLNEAFLERFPITLEFDYTTKASEKKILANVLESLDFDITDDLKQFSTDLVEWAVITRKTFDEGAVDELISTRRLVHIINAYSILDDKETSIKHCIARFDSEIRDSFFDLFTKVCSGELKTETDEIDKEREMEGEAHKDESSEVPF